MILETYKVAAARLAQVGHNRPIISMSINQDGTLYAAFENEYDNPDDIEIGELTMQNPDLMLLAKSMVLLELKRSGFFK